MPPPKSVGSMKKRKHKREINLTEQPGYSSVPTTPNQYRHANVTENEKPKIGSEADSDSDSAFGFDSAWKGSSKPTYL